MSDDLTIDIARSEDADELYSLVERVADEMVSADFTPGGSEEFYKAVRMIVFDRPEGHTLLTAKRNGALAGMIDVRDHYHICLFFVDVNEQHKGVGRQLFEEVKRRRPRDMPFFYEVNSSLFAVPIYEALGFRKLTGVRQRNGIRFVEMAQGEQKLCE
jgi:GNAT superfamily N-acetyltransferase